MARRADRFYPNTPRIADAVAARAPAPKPEPVNNVAPPVVPRPIATYDAPVAAMPARLTPAQQHEQHAMVLRAAAIRDASLDMLGRHVAAMRHAELAHRLGVRVGRDNVKWQKRHGRRRGF